VRPAQHLVAHLGGLVGVRDHHGLTLTDDLPVHHAGVELPGPPAPAQHLDVHRHDLVGQLEQPLRAGQQPAAEVGGQAEAVHVHVPVVDELDQLLDVGSVQEPGLVDDQVVERPPGRPLRTDHGPDVGVVAHLDRVVAQAHPGRDHRLPGPVVAREQQPGPTLPGVVVVDLQRERRLAAVHRPVEELEVGRHRQGPAPTGRRNGSQRPVVGHWLSKSVRRWRAGGEPAPSTASCTCRSVHWGW